MWFSQRSYACPSLAGLYGYLCGHLYGPAPVPPQHDHCAHDSGPNTSQDVDGASHATAGGDAGENETEADFSPVIQRSGTCDSTSEVDGSGKTHGADVTQHATRRSLSSRSELDPKQDDTFPGYIDLPAHASEVYDIAQLSEGGPAAEEHRSPEYELSPNWKTWWQPVGSRSSLVQHKEAEEKTVIPDFLMCQAEDTETSNINSPICHPHETLTEQAELCPVLSQLSQVGCNMEPLSTHKIAEVDKSRHVSLLKEGDPAFNIYTKRRRAASRLFPPLYERISLPLEGLEIIDLTTKKRKQQELNPPITSSSFCVPLGNEKTPQHHGNSHTVARHAIVK